MAGTKGPGRWTHRPGLSFGGANGAAIKSARGETGDRLPPRAFKQANLPSRGVPVPAAMRRESRIGPRGRRHAQFLRICFYTSLALRSQLQNADDGSIMMPRI